MKIEIAEHARMSESGSSLLRLIQNDDMPILDLLVRESVQNSTDAALEGDGPVNIEYQVRDFSSSDINKHLDGIQDNLNKRFPCGMYKLLEIKDSNTTGLIGPLHYNEVKDNQFGNLLKLIYEISKPQQKEGAGGSWGLGKTIYFRIGIGLVFYYTRIKEDNGKYSSRLAACLVEDEQKSDSLINSSDGRPKRGIAWWGQKVDKKTTTTIPLTDLKEITTILSIFNTKLYTKKETGTTIIIPYINEEKLLEGILPSNAEDNVNVITKPWWTNSVHEYLNVSLQRWYAPRLMNKNYRYGRWLRAKVNEEGITVESMLPLFRVVQALYNRTPIAIDFKGKTDILTNSDNNLAKLSLIDIFNEDSCAGYFSFVKLSREQLLMNYPENNYSPYFQINKFDEDKESNSPIILYVRKPGMIVGYETTGHWTDGIQKTSNDEFIIGIFVPKSTNTLKNLNENMSMEEYIRKSEKADHTSWTDWSIGKVKPNIISKVQRHVKKHVTEKYVKKTSEPYFKRNIGLGSVLADILLPPENFGNKASLMKKEPSGGSSVNHSGGYATKIIGQPKYENGNIKLDFELKCGKKINSFQIQLEIRSESGGIDASKWESKEGIGKKFPLELDEIAITKINLGKQKPSRQPKQFYVNKSKLKSSFEGVKLITVKTQRFNSSYGANLKVPDGYEYTIYGTVSFTGIDSTVQCGLTVSADEGEKR